MRAFPTSWSPVNKLRSVIVADVSPNILLLHILIPHLHRLSSPMCTLKHSICAQVHIWIVDNPFASYLAVGREKRSLHSIALRGGFWRESYAFATFSTESHRHFCRIGGGASG